MLLQKLGETGVGETGDSLNSGPAVTASIREGLPYGVLVDSHGLRKEWSGSKVPTQKKNFFK